MEPLHQLKRYTINSIAEFHEICNLPRPLHPLVSLIDYSLVAYQVAEPEISWIQDLYFVGIKRDLDGKFHYGQSKYDFDGGLVSFVAPKQLVRLHISKPVKRPSGYILAFHPDFLWHTSLANTIKKYDFFGYDVNEALFLSEAEEQTIIAIFRQIETEYQRGIDAFTQNIIVAQIEVLLNYCERFYQRQFITRKKGSHQVLERLEQLLNDYFNSDRLIQEGLPTAQKLAAQLHVSPNYLGSLLKNLTGFTTQQHIHNKLIERAKEKLSTTNLTISEIAYELGFEHPQSFSKLFKLKTNETPLEFRQGFV